ncbi:hypothetical protein O0L34_g2168 [Tuta absoluta]|nr:hypothetical protein O0L34_g2168 [Tuta absoluta]
MAEEDALKVYWEHFFKAETGTYEKSTWLDLFLAEFIIRVNEGANPKELIKFCPISGVVSLVGCELLCGIHRVTSSVNARCSPLPPLDTCSRNLDAATEAEPKPEDPRLLSSSALTRSTALSHTDILRQYLLRAAWRCLVLLKALGVEVSALTRSTALSHTDILRQYLLRAAWRCLVLLKALGVEVSALTRSTALSHTDILRQYLLRAAWRCLVLLKALGVEVSALTRSTALSHTDILRQYLLRAAWRCLVLLKALGVEVSALTRSTALSHTDILRQYLLRAAWRCLVLLKALGVEVSALTRSTALSHTDILRQYLLRAAWRCLVLLKALGVEVSALTRSTALSHTDILRQYLLRAAWRCLVLLKALGVEVSALTRSTALSHTDILRQYLLRAAWRCLVLLKALGVEVSALTRSTALSHTDILRQYLLRAAWRCLVLLKALGVEVSALTRSTALSHTDILRQYLLRAAWRCLVLLKALGVEVSALTRSTALSHTDILRQYLLRAAWRCLVLLKALGVEVSALTRSTALSHTDILRQYLLRAAWRCLVLLKALGVEVSALTRSTALSHTDILRQYLLRAAWRCLVLLKALGVEVSALTRSTALSHTDILRQYLLRAAWRCLVLLKALGVEVSALTRSTALSHTDILRQYLLRAAWRCLVLLKALGVEVSALTRSTALSHTDILRQYLLRAAWRCLVLLKALGVEVSALTRSTALSHTDILRQYLLRAAWRCLVLLKALGVEGMSCCRQLSSVLVWVWGELRGTGGEEGGGAAAGKAAPRTPASTATPIHQLFSHKIWTKQKLGGGSQGSKTNSAASSERSSAAGRSRHTSQVRQEVDSKTKRKFGKHSDSSDTGDSNADLQVLNRSLAVKVSTPRDDFEYFDSPGKTSNEYPNDKLYCDPFYVPKKPKPKADDYMTDKHREIINTEMSGFEFTLLILDLLQELCKTESSLSGSEGSQVSVQCINFSLRNLCSLQFGSLPQAVHYSAEQTSRVKLALTELLIVSLDKVLVHSDLCVKLINNGILPMLLRILEDIICKSSNKYSAKDDKGVKREKPNKTEADNLLKFVFGVSYSITAFFHCLLMQCRSVEKLRAFTEQFKLYGECLKGGLLKECIELMVRIPSDEEEIITLVKKLIESLGKLITGMKRVRSEVIHSAACPRSRHKACRARVVAGVHHHHDILGEAGEPRAGLPLASSCCISVLYGTLTSLVTDEEVSAQSVLRSKILRTMLNCGVCCCFSPGFLMESIVRLMLTHNSVATLSLQVLEHTVYGELGASILTARVTDQLPCSICEPNDDKRDMIRKYCPHGVSPVDRKSMWSFLIHYNSLLQLDNHNNVLHASVSHLLRVTPKCRTEMKYELLFSVIYPTFIVAKHRYILRMEEAAYFLTVSCLNIFASLLNSVPFAEQFIQKGGLSYVLELVSLSEFSNQCCSILEIAIIVEIFKLMKDNSDMTYYREVSSLSSVRMLIKSLSETTDNCYKIYKIKLSEETFGELCDLTKEREALALHVIPEISRQESLSSRKLSMPKAIKTSFAASENVIEDTVENYLDVLKNVWTFWKSCAGLCLYSPMFRQYIVSESVFVDSYAMLKVLLHQLCNNECSAPEMRILIKIVEALLTVQFAVSDVTSGRTKETSCELVRKALSGVNALSAGGGGGLKALCEALIRVCVARPSRHHAMPRASHAKLPPLGCESGASSAGGSSSEDSCEAPYASEHSEPSRLDPGYEADVEIGNLELLTLEKSRKVSGLSALKNISGYAVVEDEDLECAEYSKQSELAHPELCVIVVDVLTQLIQKLLTSPEDSPTAGMQRATAALARACCTRLAGALASTRCAPHTLLARLLAPHAAAAALLHLADPSKQGTAALARACCTRLAGALASTRCAPHTLLARLLAPHAAAAALLHLADPSKQGTAALARACCTRLAGALASTRCAPHTLLARLLAPHAAAAALLHLADPSKQGTAALARACCTRLAGALASTRCAPHTLLARLLAPHAAAAALLHLADPSKQGTAALARACCTRLAGALASTRCAPHTLLARLLAPHAAAAALLHIADPSKQGTAALARACCTRLAGALASTRCAPHTLLARLLAPHAAAAALLHIADPSKQGTAALARACCTRLAGALASTRCAPHTLLARLLAPHAAAAALLHIADPSKQGTAALARACCTRLAGALASTRCAPHTLLARLLAPHAAAAALLHIADPSKQGTAALARACCTRLAGALASTRCAPHTLLARLLAPHAAAAALLHLADPSKQGTAALARACCTRLAGALASTRCAPHTLLARLLAPHAAAAALLHIADPSKQDLQRSILELIHVVASQSITSTELAAFLRLFTAENPPLGALLTALQRLVNTAVPGTPDCILSFPVDTQHTDNSYNVSDDYVMLNNTSQSQQAESFAAKLQEAHRRAGITSPWSVGAVRCGVEGAGWAPWLQGFGLLLWVRAAPPTPPAPPSPPPDSPDEDWYSADEWNEPEEPEVKKSPVKESSIRSVELSHVMSIGTESLVLEIWMDTNTGSLTIRLTRPELGANKVVSEARVGDAAPAHKWASLALNVTERVYKRRIHIQVTVLVNGLEIETVSLPLQGILVRKVMPTLVVIGHCARGAVTGAYHLSHSHVYRAPVLNVYTALHLTAHSPDHSCQVRCDTPNYPLIITPEVLDSNIDWDQVYDISSNTLRDLHENLLLTFSASSPNIMNLYHQTVSLPTVFAGRVATTASLMGSATSASHPQGGASVPEALYVTWGGQPLTSTHRGVAPALYMLQGPAAIMPLLPRVVELEGSAEEQAQALAIILRICRADNRLYSMFYEGHSLQMLHTVLASNKCICSHHMLKVFLDEACSSTILSVSGNSLVISARCDAVVLEPSLLLLLMRAWRQLHTAQELTWEMDGPGGRTQERGSLWALTLCCLQVLVRDEHPRRSFNQYQLTRARLLQGLLSACKERFLNSECGPLEPAASTSLVQLVRGLMGSPPQLERLVLLADFLLLMHQASDTFVTHSRANFYFLLAAETQDSSEFQLHFKRRPSRRARARANTATSASTSAGTRRSEVTPSSSSVTSDDVINSDHVAKEEDRLDHSSVDSTKLVKGIINMQIKEGSDVTPSSSNVTSGEMVNENSGIMKEEDHSSVDSTKLVKGIINMQIKEGSSSNVTSGEMVNENSGIMKEEDHSSVDSTKLVKGIINMQIKEGSSSNVTSGEMVNENSGIMKEEDHSSVDSTKLVKGIINMQIKEGRKHNISSTSENSDVTFERSTSIEHKADEHTAHTHTRARPQLTGERVAGGGGEGGLEGSGKEDLKEFIVVDADDVTTATVDMYSSGIFHQRTVKAGAEPGWSACEGLLLLLRDTIAVLPDHALAQAVAGAIQAEVLIVLGNHRSGRVRAALVRAMAGLARRAPADLAKKLRANNYYVHLANQISLYPATWELAAACAALLTKCDVPLEDQLDDDIWLDINEEAVLRSPPLLALLPVCLDDVPLAHNITLLIRRLIDKASLKTLNEVSVAEVVIKAIRGIGQLGSADYEGRDLLLDDLFELLNRLAVKASNSQHNLQTITEIHHMLTYVEWSGAARGETAVVRVARDAQHSLYMAQLDHLEDRLHTSYTAHTKYANYFTTVLSSAVSIGAEAVSRAERTELASRHLATVVRAVSFLLTQSPRHSAVEEAPLVERLFATLLPAVSGAAPTRPKWWVGGGADWVSPLQELFCWAASPAPGVQPLQAGLLRALYRAPPPALPLLAPPDPPAMRKLAVYLLTMLKHIHAEAEAGTPPVELAITDWARGWAVGTQAGLAERVPSDTLIVEAERLLEIDEERWAKIAAKQRPQVAKVVYSKDGLAHRLTEGAMLITRQVVDIQNGERKAFMEQLRRAHSDAVACTQRWARAVDALTHEQAVWHDPRSYPQSWQLDATEGVGRVRVRLRRAHLDIQDKFLLPNSRGKLEAINRSPPLRSVVGCYAGLRGGLVARLQLNETVSYMTRVTYVTVCSETEGELLLSDRCIHFVPEDSEDEATPPKKGARPMSKSSAQSWPLEAVVQVATRRWCLQERAAELFLSSGHAHLLAFTDFNERAVFLKALERCHLPGRQEPDTLTEAMTQWRNGAITNWEYLMRLNGLAGRTYNDLMQYPVLPFILADYTSRILDLDNPASFRDLSKPMAIQNKNREQHYINTYNDLKMARREGCSPLLRQAQPHHYASLYSNSGGVLHYLVRLPPFTELFLNYQGE